MKYPLLLLTILLICLPAWVFAGSSVHARVEGEQWNTGIAGASSGILAGVGVSHRLAPRIGLSGGMVFGSYGELDKDPDASLSRLDIDFAAAYQFNRIMSVYGGYRITRISFDNSEATATNFDDTTHGPGIGVGVFQPLNSQLISYGRVGLSYLLSSVTPNSEENYNGSGFGFGTELGLHYRLSSELNAGLSLKYENTSISYDQATDWKHNYLRLGLSVGYVF